MPDAWIAQVESSMKDFAANHDLVFTQSARQVAASFEIGCLHALTEFYARGGYDVHPINLSPQGEYLYLTTPSGNPENFSHISLTGHDGVYELRQQVRVCSHLHPEIQVTPDLVVLAQGAVLNRTNRPDYARGKRGFFYVESADVVAAHECKSMTPFPELLVGFLGILETCRAWMDSDEPRFCPSEDGPHLAPSIFIGGDARGIHFKMIEGLERTFPLNVIVGLHTGGLSLLGGRDLRRPESAEVTGAV